MISVERARKNVKEHEEHMISHALKQAQSWADTYVSPQIEKASKDGCQMAVISCDSTYFDTIVKVVMDMGYKVVTANKMFRVMW